MKIDRSKIRKSHSQPAPECERLIQRLTEAKDGDLVNILKSVDTWFYGKCDLGHWADVLDRFDDILASVGKPVNGSAWILTYDKLDVLEGPEVAAEKRELVNQVLRFTALLIEHAYSRPAYNSAEHLITLLGASDMEVVLSVLGLLYVFSKRCSFIPRLPADKRKPLQQRLLHVGESWGGKNGGFSLAECCKNKPLETFPESAGDVHFEFYMQGEDNQTVEHTGQEKESQVCDVHVEKLYQFSENPGEIMEQLMAYYKVPIDKQVGLFSRVRLARHFPVYQERLQCVQARLWAISVLVYSNVSQDIQKSLMYQGFEEEVVELLQLEDPELLFFYRSIGWRSITYKIKRRGIVTDIKTAGIRLLTSVIHLQFNPGGRLNTIVDCAGMSSYHGFLPTLMRNCIQTLTDPSKTPYPMSFSTALFSFVYHFACFEVGNDALVSSGLVESLLRVIEYSGDDEHLTFVTRSVRIMDWIGNTDTSGYQSGLKAVIDRLEHEVKICIQYHGGILTPDLAQPSGNQDNPDIMETNESSPSPSQDSTKTIPMETEQAGPSGIEVDASKMEVEESGASSRISPTSLQVTQQRCLPQRAALIKALLSFLKKAIPDPAFSETIRTIMDGSLPTSLKYIISNVEYYGPVLFLGAIDTVTVYVFHEPSLLSSLQDNGLTGVVMKSLVLKDIPAMREVLSSLPSVLSALCLNTRGLQAFMACQPFDKLFRVMLSPEYLPAMRRKKATEELGETASNLGIAMDELMRHQPTLKTDAMKAVVKLLEQVCELGQDPKSIGYKINESSKDGDLQDAQAQGNVPNLPSQASEEPMTDDEFDDDDRFSFTSASSKTSPEVENNKDKELSKSSEEEKRIYVPLTDYILNVVKFVDAILSNNSTDDHCSEFVRHKGLVPLLGILGLPNLSLDFPSSPSCQAVCSVSKSLLMLAHEPQVLKQGMVLLKESLDKLQPSVYNPSENTDLSICHEVVSASKPDKAMHSPQQTPVLHAVSAVHAYITMFLYVCRSGQMDIRTMCINHWGSDLGLGLLAQLGELYMSLLWETTVLETVVKEEQDLINENKDSVDTTGGEASVSEDQETASKTSKPEDDQKSPLMPSQRRIVKQLLQVNSNVSKSLSEFFGALLKLSVGTAQRQRRTPHSVATPGAPSLSARLVTSQLCQILKNALSWNGAAADNSSPGLRLHFYVNTVNFASRLLFDDKKFPYHLMLQQFMISGALNSLFEKFNLVLSQGGKVSLENAADHPDLPDGTEEMIDAWLVFVEKLVNAKAVLESPHSLPNNSNTEGFVPFKPIQFLIKAHKRAFTSVGYLWGHKPFKVHGSHIAETMLSIFCHVLQGESIINEKQGPSKTTPSMSSAAARQGGQGQGSSLVTSRAATPPQPEVNESNIQQLIDMGFTRAQARHALLSTSNLEQATEYILSHPYPVPGEPLGDPHHGHEFGFDFEMSEEDQMMRAIALSLGQDISPMAVDQPAAAAATSSNTSTDKKPDKPEPKQCEDESQLAKEILDDFTLKIFSGCQKLLEDLPDTVYKACKLLAAVARRNGAEWRDKVLAEVMEQVGKDTITVIKACSPENNMDKYIEEFAPQMCTMTEAARLSSLLHLLCLMFEEMKVSCALLLEQYGIVNSLMDLMELCQASLVQLSRTVNEPTTPKWLCPLLLLLDLYEKTALSSERKKLHRKFTTRVWRWFDDRSGRWYAYSATNNEAIDTAYRNGETRTRFMAGRRHYNVNFSTMLQINEDTGSRRPIMLGSTYESPPLGSNNRTSQHAQQAIGEGDTAKKQQDTGAKKAKEDKKVSKTEEPEMADKRTVQCLSDAQKSTIIRCCSILICIPVSHNALHAALRLCLRITQEHKFAVQFVDQGGHKAIIGLTQKSSFPGFTSIATLLLHHVLEDSANLQHTIEKVIRSVAMNGVSNAATGVSPNSVGAKEINYVLRLLGPAASRNPQLFLDAALKVLRYAITPQLRRVLVEGADVFLPSNHAQLVTVSPSSKPQKFPPLCNSVREVVCDLLNALCAPDDLSRTGGRASSMCVRRSDSQMLGELGRALGQLGDMIDRFSTNTRDQSLTPGHPSYGRQITSEDNAVDNDEPGIDSSQGSHEVSTSNFRELKEKSQENTEEKAKKDNKEKEAAKPLLTKSAILRILAELVKTYGGVAQLITEYTYSAPTIPGEKQYEGPVLAYIFDHLLTSTQNNTSNEAPAFARLLLAVIATCTQAPDAQQILVTELKASLDRALALPESPGKHNRLQGLFGLIQTMIDSGSRPPQQSLLNQPPNNTMKLLTKRGLITDLARVTHSLDLGSPNLVTTLNALLKPLEKLSSIVNQPTGSAAQNKVATQSTGVGTRDGASTQTESSVQVSAEANQGAVTAGEERTSQDQVQTQDADVQWCDLGQPEDTQASGGDDQEGEDSVASWDMGVSGHAVVPVAIAEHELEDFEEMVEELLDRDTRDLEDSEVNVLADEIVSGRLLGDGVIEAHVDDDDSDSISSSDSDEGSNGSNHSDSDDNEDTMVITFEQDHDVNDVNNLDNQQEDDVDGDDERVIVTTGDDAGDEHENVVVMGEVDDGDEDIEDDDDDDDDDDEAEDDDDEGGSDMEEEHPDMMEDDSFAVYEDDDMFLRIRDEGGPGRLSGEMLLSTVQDEDSDAGVVLGLSGQRHRALPIRRHTGAADVFHFTSGGHETRLLVGDDGQMREITDEDGLFVDGYSETTSSIPSALSRWSEESQILDPESVHYCVSALKPELFPVFEKRLGEEVAKEKIEDEKKKKEAEAKAAVKKKEDEEAAKKKAESEAATPATANQQPSEEMQVDQTSASQAAPVATDDSPNSSLLVSMSMDHGCDTEPEFQTSTPRESAATPTAEDSQNIPTEPSSSSIEDQTSSTVPPAVPTSSSIESQSVVPPADAMRSPPIGSPMTMGSEASVASTESGAQSMAMGETAEDATESSNKDETTTESAAAQPEASTSGENVNLTIDGISIPEGVDPSFLEALPESLRREVLSEQLGLRPPPPPPSQPAGAAGSEPSAMSVSPEFLAALPPDVQEEVLQQQRLEQERRRVATTNPDQPVDPGAFLRNLPPQLRQTVLADIDDSLLNVLPAEMATEAQSLRRDRELRQQRLVQERYAFGDTASAISTLLRHSGLSRRALGGPHFPRYFSQNARGFSNSAPRANHKYAGRQLLDHDALACLVVLLFIDEPRLNTARLQKVFRNLCYHEETRRWLINTLIAVLRRTSGLNDDESCPRTTPSTQGEPTASASTSSGDVSHDSSRDHTRYSSSSRIEQYLIVKGESSTNLSKNKQPSWLRVAIDSALGTRTSVFCIRRHGKLGMDCSSHISIHQYASPFICRHVLDALLFLAKTFSTSFMPTLAKAKTAASATDNSELDEGEISKVDSDFWDILLKLDAVGLGRKGKYSANSSVTPSEEVKQEEEFAHAPIGKLLTLLSHPIVCKSVQLTDKLLRLLSVISSSLPTLPSSKKSPAIIQSNSVTGVSEGQSGQNLVVPLPQVVTPEAARAVPLVLEPNEEHGVTTNLTIPISETESIASSLVVERSSEPGGEQPEVDSIDSGSSDDVPTHTSQTEPMVVEVNIPHDSSAERIDRPSSLLTTDVRLINTADLTLVKPENEQTVVMEGHLRLAVNVLTSGSCSEEGLEDVTTLLLQISRLNIPTRDTILRLLLDGARKIGEILCKNIAQLFIEIVEHNKTSTPQADTERDPLKVKKTSNIVLPEPPRRPQRTVRGLFGLQEPTTAAAAAGGRRQAGPKPVVYELHLPSMPELTCKKSSQALLLKILKVILQLRDAAKRSGKPPTARERRQRRGVPSDVLVSHRLIESSRGLGAVVAALEAEAEAIFEVFSSIRNQRGREDRELERGQPQPGSSTSGGAAGEGSTEGQGGQDGSSGAGGSQVTEPVVLPLLSEQLGLDDLWDTLGECLTELAKTTDSHAVLVLQPAVEAFFLVHGSEKTTPPAQTTPAQTTPAQDAAPRVSSSSEMFPPPSPGPTSPGAHSPSRQMSVSSVTSDLPTDTQKFLKFAETHRTVLNQILRQSNVHLSDGPFAVLVNHTRVLDFDVKRRFFRQELERADEGMRRDDLPVHLRRDHVFEDSYRELHRRNSEEWKSRFYIVFEGEEGQDAGGLLREWYLIMSREMFNPNYALFTTSPGDRVTYQPNPSSHCNSNHLSYFKFVGRVVSKAIYDNKLLECFFTRSFYKHILGKPVHFTDLESFDYSFYQGLQFLLEHDIHMLGMDLTFSTDVQEFGLSEIRDLIPNGRNIPVAEENKRQYVKLVCQMKMTGAIRKQIDSFLEGFYEVIPKRLISIFDEQELELLISGLPNIDLDDLKANSEYHKYSETSLQIQWFWRALRSFDQADRAKFLQFVTGTSKVPLQGFAALEGMNGFQKFQIHRDDRNTDRLPSAHTCFNQLDLPAYETYDKLRTMLKKACDECPEGFGLA